MKRCGTECSLLRGFAVAVRSALGGLVLLPLLLATPVLATSCDSDATDLTIGAAASLTEFMNTATTTVSSGPTPTLKTKPRVNFGASSWLATQIRAGAPIDILISADRRTLDRLGTLVEQTTRRIIATGTVVLVGNKRSTFVSGHWPKAGLTELHKNVPGTEKLPSIRIATTNPSVPIGAYTAEIVSQLPEDGQRFVASHSARFENVRAALAAVQVGAADLAFVYRSDLGAMESEKNLVILQSFTASAQDSSNATHTFFDANLRNRELVIWEAAITTAAKNRAAAVVMMNWLGSKVARDELTRLGFGPPPNAHQTGH